MGLQPALNELLRLFRANGYAAFEDAANAPPAGWMDKFWRNKRSDRHSPISEEGYILSRLCLYLAMHDYSFDLANGLAVDAAFTEGHGDRGIDGAAIQIGNRAILSVSEAEEVFAESAGAPIRVLLLQAKRRGNANDYRDDVVGDDVSKFGYDGRRFLERHADYLASANPNLRRQKEIYDKVRQLCDASSRPFNPEIIFLFGYGGRVTENVNPSQLRTMVMDDLQDSFPNSRLEFEVWGWQDIVAASDFAKVGRSCDLRGANLISIPKGPASSAYIGWVNAKGLLDALSRERKKRGEKVRELDYRFFADNPRYYLKLRGPRKDDSFRENDWNPGAFAIKETLDNKQGARIGLGHNGVTIVARDLKVLKNNAIYRLVDPQVVNGCQSCFVLDEEIENIFDVILPLKVIVTTSRELSGYVVEAANTQRPLNEWDLLSLRPEIRQLQREFERGPAEAKDRLWLRRRFNDPLGEWIPDIERGIPARELVSLAQAILLGRPDLAHQGKSGDAIGLVGKETFLQEHEPRLYVMLGWLHVAWRKWGKSKGQRSGDRYNIRYQLMFAMWHLIDATPDDLTTNTIKRGDVAQRRFDTAVNKILADIDNGFSLLEQAEKILTKAAAQQGRAVDGDLARLKMTTDNIRQIASQSRT